MLPRGAGPDCGNSVDGSCTTDQRSANYGSTSQAQCAHRIPADLEGRSSGCCSGLVGYPRRRERAAGSECAGGRATGTAESSCFQATVFSLLGDVHTDIGRIPAGAVQGAGQGHGLLYHCRGQVVGEAHRGFGHAYPLERGQAGGGRNGGGLAGNVRLEAEQIEKATNEAWASQQAMQLKLIGALKDARSKTKELARRDHSRTPRRGKTDAHEVSSDGEELKPANADQQEPEAPRVAQTGV